VSIALSILLIIACLAASAFFSSSETALLRLRSHDLEEEVETGHGPSAVAVRDLLSSTSRLLVTILLGNNVANILGASVASALAVRLFGLEIGIVVATLTMTVLVLIGSEIVPKAVAARHPLGVSRVVGLPLYLLHQLLRPVHALFDRILEPLVARITGGQGSDEALSSEEVLRLARMAREGEEKGTPLAIIGATSAAAEMDVNEIMVKRPEIVAHPVSMSPNVLLEELLEERYTRVPLYEETIDEVLGVVHMKDVVKLAQTGGGDLHGILKPILRVPERKPILRLLAEMQRSFCHMAIVKDEFGTTLGLVTQEDILEEIVGEIRDEFDFEELLTVRKLPGNVYEVLGRVSVRDFNRESGWELPAEKGDTLGGLFFNTLEHSPRRGDKVLVGGYELTCADVSGSRITRIRVSGRTSEEDQKAS
jgi:CBS domain containing-hemolysin-like protein